MYEKAPTLLAIYTIKSQKTRLVLRKVGAKAVLLHPENKQLLFIR